MHSNNTMIELVEPSVTRKHCNQGVPHMSDIYTYTERVMHPCIGACVYLCLRVSVVKL